MSRVPPQFQKFMEEFFGDKTDVLFPGANLLKVKISLDAVFADTSFPYQGDIVYADRDSTGIAYIKFNSSGTAAFPFVRNTVVRGMPVKELIVSNPTAQPGLFLNVWVGYGAEIIPPTLDIATIAGVVTTVDGGQAYASKFTSTAAIATATNETQIAAASNINGIVLHGAEFNSVNATAPLNSLAFHAFSSAPTAYTDGDILCGVRLANSIGANFLSYGALVKPLSVLLGKAVWFRNSDGVSETAGKRSLLYTLK